VKVRANASAVVCMLVKLVKCVGALMTAMGVDSVTIPLESASAALVGRVWTAVSKPVWPGVTPSVGHAKTVFVSASPASVAQTVQCVNVSMIAVAMAHVAALVNVTASKIGSVQTAEEHDAQIIARFQDHTCQVCQAKTSMAQGCAWRKVDAPACQVGLRRTVHEGIVVPRGWREKWQMASHIVTALMVFRVPTAIWGLMGSSHMLDARPPPKSTTPLIML